MDKPIRVLHVLTAMNLAGTETLLMNLYRNIDRSKIQFDFAVTTNKKCAYDDEIESLGGRIIHYPLYRGVNHLSYVSWWNKFFRQHEEYHIVHGHIGSTAAIYLHIAKKYGRYTIAHSHSTYGPLNLHTILYKIFSYPTRYIADYFFGCSKDALVDRYGKKILNKDNARVLNNGIDAQKYIYSNEVRESIRKEFNLKKDEIIIGTVGRLTPQKNPFFIAHLIKGLLNSNLSFRFLWIGTGELESELKEMLSEEVKKRQVIFAGTRKDVNKCLQAMDIFVFPSVYEGLGIAAVEAQASGLITICSDRIPREVAVTEMCSFLSVNTIELWEETIKNIINSERSIVRKNQYDKILKAGYDIHGIVKWLSVFYLKHN